MKKAIILILIVLLGLSVFTGCATKDPPVIAPIPSSSTDATTADVVMTETETTSLLTTEKIETTGVGIQDEPTSTITPTTTTKTTAKPTTVKPTQKTPEQSPSTTKLTPAPTTAAPQVKFEARNGTAAEYAALKEGIRKYRQECGDPPVTFLDGVFMQKTAEWAKYLVSLNKNNLNGWDIKIEHDMKFGGELPNPDIVAVSESIMTGTFLTPPEAKNSISQMLNGRKFWDDMAVRLIIHNGGIGENQYVSVGIWFDELGRAFVVARGYEDW